MTTPEYIPPLRAGTDRRARYDRSEEERRARIVDLDARRLAAGGAIKGPMADHPEFGDEGAVDANIRRVLDVASWVASVFVVLVAGVVVGMVLRSIGWFG